MTYNPSTPYAASRAAGDMSLKTFVDNYNFPAVSTRAANVFGPGQQLYRIIPRTILYIRQGKNYNFMAVDILRDHLYTSMMFLMRH